MEIIISSVNGGRGSVEIRDLKFKPLPQVPDPKLPLKIYLIPSSLKSMHHNNPQKIWRRKNISGKSILVDNGYFQELGCLQIDWDEKDFAADYDVFVSEDKNKWEKAFSVRDADGGIAFNPFDEL